MGIRVNEDGLVIRSGVDEAAPAVISEYRTDGPLRILEIEFNLENLPVDADGSVIASYGASIPAGAQIEYVEITTFVDVDSAGDAFILDVGLTDADGGSNVTDVDGLVDAATQTEMNTGGRNVAGWVGDDVGTVIVEKAYVTWEVTVADATAGVGVIRVAYSMPDVTTDALGT